MKQSYELDLQLLSLLEEIVAIDGNIEGLRVNELIQALNSGEIRYCTEHDQWEVT